MANKISPQYDKELKRIKRNVTTLKKQGFAVPDNIIPAKPKRITEGSIRRLKKITPQYIKSKSKQEASKPNITRKKSKAPKSTNAQFNAELRRINRTIKGIESRGYTVFKDFIPTKPEFLTEKDVEQLKQITANVIYANALYIVPETGEILPGLAGRRLERRNAQLKPKKEFDREKWFDDVLPGLPGFSGEPGEPDELRDVSDEILERINNWAPLPNWSEWLTEVKRNDKNILRNFLNGVITRDGKKEVANRLQQNADRVNELADDILYGSPQDDKSRIDRGSMNAKIVEFMALCNGRALTADESIIITDYMEQLFGEE